MTDLFVLAVWAAHVMHARIAFHVRRVKLAPVTRKIRIGLLPAVLAALVGSYAQAHSVPAAQAAGAALETRYVEDVLHDGMSLDEAVRRAEAQFHARVVRTD